MTPVEEIRVLLRSIENINELKIIQRLVDEHISIQTKINSLNNRLDKTK